MNNALRGDDHPLPSVRELLSVLGPSTLRLLSAEAGLELGVTHQVLHDPWTPPEETSHGLLLGAGLRLGSPDLPAQLDAWASHGYRALVVKTHQDDPTTAARAADSAGLALLAIPDDLGWLQAERLLRTALDNSRRREGPSLSSLAVGDLFALASAIASATGGATAIEDPTARVLAYSTHPEQPIDEERRDGILGRQVPPTPGNDQQYLAVHAESRAQWLPSHTQGMGRVAVGVRSGGEVLGSIWVVDPGDDSLVPEVESVLEQAAEIAALHLLRHRSAEDFARLHRAELVERVLIDGDPAAAAQLGMGPRSQIAVVALEPRDPDALPDLSRLLGALSLGLEARLPGSGFVAHAGRVVGVLAVAGRVDRTVTDLVREVVSVAERAVRTELLAGVGPVVTGPRAAAQSRAAAEQVLSLLRHSPDLGAVGNSTDLEERLVLRTWARQLTSLDALSKPAAAILIEDKERDTDQARMLLAWLGSGRDVKHTAQVLQVHHNTVRYRLDRLRERHELRFDDPDQMLTLWLGLRLAHESGEIA